MVSCDASRPVCRTGGRSNPRACPASRPARARFSVFRSSRSPGGEPHGHGAARREHGGVVVAGCHRRRARARPERPADSRALPAARITPMMAPPTAPPPILARASPAGEAPSRKMISVWIGIDEPSASRIVWKRTPSRARVLNLPPCSANVTEPRTFEPAGTATCPATRTSRVTRPSTRSSTRAKSLEMVRSICTPMTASAGISSSSRSRPACGGAGAAASTGVSSSVGRDGM